MVEGSMDKKWYEQTWVIVLFLIFFWPVGLFLMWRFADWKKAVKTIVTVVISAYFVICIIIGIVMMAFIFNAFSEQSSLSNADPIGIEDELDQDDIGSILDEETEWDLDEEADDTEEVASDDHADSAEGFSRLEDLTLHFDDRDWQVGFEDEQPGVMMREYVVDGESVEAWTELVTAQFFPDLQGIDSAEFVDLMKESMEGDATGKLEWNVFNEKEDGLMYEFILTEDELYGDQHEVARVIEADDGLFILHYAIMEAPMSDEHHKQWVDRLGKATVKN